MPRRPRTEAPGAIHHVIARGNGGCRIVVDDKDRVAFIDRVACVCDEFEWRLHAYCLMDTHVHAVIETPKPTLGAGMQKLVGGHAYMFNRRHQCSGHLFAGPYYAAELAGEAHLVEACVYVVLNPVRARLVAHPAKWRWSSYRAAAGAEPVPGFVATEILPDALSPDPGRARELYRRMVDEVAARRLPGSG